MRALKKFDNKKVGLTPKELALLEELDTPGKIQDFISGFPQNFEEDGDSCMSVREVLATRRGHCIEGALVAALALWIHGERPLLMDLTANGEDDDHVITLFQKNGYWGAISKSNHAVLRYRDPVYRTLRELALSYIHEYYNAKGVKTLRTFSRPLNLTTYDPEIWITGNGAWKIASDLCEIQHWELLNKGQEKLLRPLDDFEKTLLNITEYKRKK